MLINANSIRVGNIIEYNKALCQICKPPVHTKPGKGGAFVQAEMKDIINGTKYNVRFRSEEMVEKVRLDQHDYQFQYMDGDFASLMDMTSFESIMLDKELFGEQLPFLKEGMMICVETYEEKPLSVKLPDTVIIKVEEAEPVVKGQTAASSYKPAILENGVRIMVPPFIEAGERIVVKTEDATYVERAKNND